MFFMIEPKNGLPDIKTLNRVLTKNDPELLAQLIPREQWVAMRDGEGFTLLHGACMNGAVNIVQTLIDMGADRNAITINGETPLIWAIRHSCDAVVEMLIQYGVDVNRPDSRPGQCHSPLITALMLGEHDSIARRLISAGANVNAVNANAETALHWTAVNGDVDMACFLIEKGANPWAKDCQGLDFMRFAWEDDFAQQMQSVIAKKEGELLAQAVSEDNMEERAGLNL